jgi:hypothetical protein
MHINRDFEVDVYKAMEVFVSAKKFLSIKVIKIELNSILYETLKWPQIAPFCISSKKIIIPDPLSLSRIMACTLLILSYASVSFMHSTCA